MPLRAGRVPNSSSISRCMRLKSLNWWLSRPLRFRNMVLSPVTVAAPARYFGSAFPVSCVTVSIPITTEVVSIL
jgi:hypothetical protein